VRGWLAERGRGTAANLGWSCCLASQPQVLSLEPLSLSECSPPTVTFPTFSYCKHPPERPQTPSAPSPPPPRFRLHRTLLMNEPASPTVWHMPRSLAACWVKQPRLFDAPPSHHSPLLAASILPPTNTVDRPSLSHTINAEPPARGPPPRSHLLLCRLAAWLVPGSFTAASP
jgi:hypothetical protein